VPSRNREWRPRKKVEKFAQEYHFEPALAFVLGDRHIVAILNGKKGSMDLTAVANQTLQIHPDSHSEELVIQC
jgi:hypothetical protein